MGKDKDEEYRRYMKEKRGTVHKEEEGDRSKRRKKYMRKRMKDRSMS